MGTNLKNDRFGNFVCKRKNEAILCNFSNSSTYSTVTVLLLIKVLNGRFHPQGFNALLLVPIIAKRSTVGVSWYYLYFLYYL